MHRTTILAAAAALALPLAGCGEEPRRPPGTIEVVEESTGQPMWMEGSIGFARVEDAGGRVVHETPVRDEPTEYPRTLVRQPLEAGRYRVTSWQRPCQGSCSLLDPPVARCAAEVEVRPGEVARVTVLVGERCSSSSD